MYIIYTKHDMFKKNRKRFDMSRAKKVFHLARS